MLTEDQLAFLNTSVKGDFDPRLRTDVAEHFNALNEAYKEQTGNDIPLVSAFRDKERNTRAGGSATSNHLHGAAFDVDFKKVDFKVLEDLAPDFGFGNPVKSFKNKKTGKTQSERNHFEFLGDPSIPPPGKGTETAQGPAPVEGGITQDAGPAFQPLTFGPNFQPSVNPGEVLSNLGVQPPSQVSVNAPQPSILGALGSRVSQLQSTRVPEVNPLAAFGTGLQFGAAPLSVTDLSAQEAAPLPFLGGQLLGAFGRGAAGFAATPAIGFTNLAAQGFEFETARQLRDLEAGNRTQFDLPLALGAGGLNAAAGALVPTGASNFARTITGALGGGAATGAGIALEQFGDTGRVNLLDPELAGNVGLGIATGGLVGRFAPSQTKIRLRKDNQLKSDLLNHLKERQAARESRAPKPQDKLRLPTQKPGESAAQLHETKVPSQPPLFNDLKFGVEHGKPKPRFGKTALVFESDVDSALYIVANRDTLSQGDGKFVEFLRKAFPTLDDESILRLAKKTKNDHVKPLAKGGADEVLVPSGFQKHLDELFPASKIQEPTSELEGRLFGTAKEANATAKALTRETGIPHERVQDKVNGLYVVRKKGEKFSFKESPYKAGEKVTVGGRKGTVKGGLGDFVAFRDSRSGRVEAVHKSLVDGLTVDGVPVNRSPQVQPVQRQTSTGRPTEDAVVNAGFDSFTNARRAVELFSAKRSAKGLSEGDAQTFAAVKSIPNRVREVLKTFDDASQEFISKLKAGAKKADDPAIQTALSKIKDDSAQQNFEIIAEALKKGESVEITYITEKTGRTGELRPFEMHPTHFSVSEKGNLQVHGVNSQGQFRQYDLFSQGGQTRVVSSLPTGRQALQGPAANVYLGPKVYDPNAILTNAEVGQGIRTSQQKAVGRGIKVLDGVDDKLANQLREQLKGDPTAASFEKVAESVKRTLKNQSDKSLRAFAEKLETPDGKKVDC